MCSVYLAGVLVSQTARVKVSYYVSLELFPFHSFVFQFGSLKSRSLCRDSRNCILGSILAELIMFMLCVAVSAAFFSSDVIASSVTVISRL